jgi:Protein of unknown function (DUF3455)
MRRGPLLTISLIASTTGLMAFKGPGGGKNKALDGGCVEVPENLPAALRAPGTARPMLELYADGTQNYRCTATDGGASAWTLVAPEATLHQCTAEGPVVGKHFAGPSWQREADGSKFVGNAALAVKVPAPSDPSKDIPWLLVPQKAPGTTAGSFGAFSYVQRVNTAGGVAPKDGCGAATVGSEVRVPYHASYIFYENH